VIARLNVPTELFCAKFAFIFEKGFFFNYWLERASEASSAITSINILKHDSPLGGASINILKHDSPLDGASCKVRQLSDLADEFDSCLTLQLAPPSGESCLRMNNYMFILWSDFLTVIPMHMW
jgi:hypothetical protein